VKYGVFASLEDASEYQAQVDMVCGFPEPPEKFSRIGIPPHAPIEVGRALHYAKINTDATQKRFALPLSPQESPKKGIETIKLTEDWSLVKEPVDMDKKEAVDG
jgi:hypothetical protein